MSTTTEPTTHATPTRASTHELSDAIRAHHRALAETLDGYTSDVEAGTNDLELLHPAVQLDITRPKLKLHSFARWFLFHSLS